MNSAFIKLREIALQCTHGCLECRSCIERGEQVQMAIDALDAALSRETRNKNKIDTQNEVIRNMVMQVLGKPQHTNDPVQLVREMCSEANFWKDKVRKLEEKVKQLGGEG